MNYESTMSGHHRKRLGSIFARTFVIIVAAACSYASFAGDGPLQSEAAFKGKIGVSVEDSVPAWPQPIKAHDGAPNVVVILLDDVGFGATSAFGGPVRTPALDQLAGQGLRYNRFHTSAQCSPTRAALLSGRNDHRVGFGLVGEGGFPGYNTIWPKSAVSIPEVLRRNGYRTAAFGKWHNTPEWEISPIGPFDRWPTGLGFEYFYGFMGAAENHWKPAHLYRNTTLVEPPATVQQGYHLTTDVTNEAIRWLHTHQSLAAEKPYFLYFATGAAHAPHHVAKEWIERYRGQFDAGWDRMRETIFERQKKLGVIPSNAELTRRPRELPAWNSLSADRRKLLARQMEVFAGFLEHTDHEIGRLLQTVRESPGGQNTLVLYVVGDNGASSESGLLGGDTDEESAATLRERMDQLGSPRYSYNQYSSGWAWATSTPFQWQKLIASHLGGTRVPLVVSWPARIKNGGGLRTQYTHVNDVAATLYDAAGIEFPSVVDGVAQLPLDGVSFAESFENATTASRHTQQIYEQWGNRAVYRDGWLASARHFIPWDPGRWTRRDYERDSWELYRLDDDFSQARDLAAKYPQKLQELQTLFDVEAGKNNIYPLGGAKELGNSSVFQEERYAISGKKEFFYYADLPRLPAWQVPAFSRPHRITADVVIPAEGAEGVIIAAGSGYGGFALYVKDKHLFYESSAKESNALLSSPELLPVGKAVIEYEFTLPKDSNNAAGTGRLYVNGKLIAEAPRSSVETYGGSLGVGQAHAPIGSSFSIPFKFRGVLNSVKVELK